MIRIVRLCLLPLTLALFLASGCAPAVHNPASPATQAAEEAPMDYIYALQTARQWYWLRHGGFPSYYYYGPETTNDETGVTLTTREKGTFRCLYKDNANPVFSRKSVQFNCGGTRIVVEKINNSPESEELARAWRTMAAGIPPDMAGITPEFEALAASYRANPAAHVMNERTRELKVQAESFVRENKPYFAVQRFREALAISPWWPQGRFNLALIYGELGLYRLASVEMEKYLKLAPDAPNARAAQDKVYVWRGKFR